MKTVILCGGLGTRLSEETTNIPKPMVTIGGIPILCHIMNIYSHYGFNDFVICCGYKGYMIKEYFAHYFLHQADVTFDFAKDTKEIHCHKAQPWKVTLVDTGEDTLTGARLKQVEKYLNNERFMLTYGDGLADINIRELVAFHHRHQKVLTVTASRPQGRFGALDIDNSNNVNGFIEKPQGDTGWINSGFMVCEPEFLNYISGNVMLENEPIKKAVENEEINAYRHYGTFQPMDTIRDKNILEEEWKRGAFWKVL